MQTQIFAPSQVKEAAALIQLGEIVAFPTETVYGLGASIFSQEAIEKIYWAKGRPQDNPLIAHIASLKQAEQLAKELPKIFYTLAKAFFPGPLTLVVHRAPSVPEIVSGGLPTIALRQPSLPLARAFIAAAKVPLVAPSANLSGKPSGTTARHVLQDLQGRIAGLIDAGPSNIGIESTVLDLVSFKEPTILRPGKITHEELEKALGIPVANYLKGPKASPGMRYRHYAPTLPVKVFHTRALMESYLKAAPYVRRMVLSPDAISGSFQHYALTMETFYTCLRLADEDKYEELLVVCDQKMLKHAGLLDRIKKLNGE